MHRLLTLAPALALFSLVPGAGFWGPIVLLVGLIFIHELGHFLVAKWMGIPVAVFSIGFPAGFKGDHLVLFHWKETEVRLAILPLGGYVQLAGYNDEEPSEADPNGFLAQPTWKRLAFYSGGIVANVLVTMAVFFWLGVEQARTLSMKPEPSPLLVVEVLPGSAADKGGLKAEDQIRALGDLTFPGARTEDAMAYIQARAGQTIQVTVERAGALRTFPLVPRDEAGKGKLGVSFGPASWITERRPFQAGDLLQGARTSVVGSASLGWQILGGLGKLVSGQASFREVGGPISIVRAGSRAAKAGMAQFLFITAMISMNLAILNALPIPFLDGGHALILIFEKLRGRDLAIPVKERILQGGFIFLASLMVFVIALDLWKLRH